MKILIQKIFNCNKLYNIYNTDKQKYTKTNCQL